LFEWSEWLNSESRKNFLKINVSESFFCFYFFWQKYAKKMVVGLGHAPYISKNKLVSWFAQTQLHYLTKRKINVSVSTISSCFMSFSTEQMGKFGISSLRIKEIVLGWLILLNLF